MSDMRFDSPVLGEFGIRCLWMRGGTSKGAYFLASDLPTDPDVRDRLLLSIMGSPDIRQIDGIGGADPLTSKVAILSPSSRPNVDVDYLFLQVSVDKRIVSDAQGCGNILAGVGPVAIELGLVPAEDGTTRTRIYMINTGQIAYTNIQTPQGRVTYIGSSSIDGVPGTHAPVPLMFQNIAGSKCGALLPTGNPHDHIQGLDCTLIDYGMPCVLVRASALGLSGQESCEDLESNTEVRETLERLRRAAGFMMNLGDVSESTVPKVVLLSPPMREGTINTRCFIPHRVHKSIGVFVAITVATATAINESIAYNLAEPPSDGQRYKIEHPSGSTEVILEFNSDGRVIGAGNLRTARKLFDGFVFPGVMK